MKSDAIVISEHYGEKIEKNLKQYYVKTLKINHFIKKKEKRDKIRLFVVEPEFGNMNQTLQAVSIATNELSKNVWGSLIFILSEAGNHGAAFAAENYFWQGFMKSLACELGEKNILVNAIILHDEKSDEAVVETVQFLSEKEAYITAQSIHINERKYWINAKEIQEKKVVVITGAGQGIGGAIADFLKDDYIICLNDLHRTESMISLEKNYSAEILVADISDKIRIDEQLEKIIKRYGHIDVLVANAAFMKLDQFSGQAIEMIEKHYNINVKGHLYCLDKVSTIMKKQGRGIIVLFSSMFGILGWKNGTGYASTKTAMIGLTKYYHEKYAECGIATVAVAPGVISTPQLQADADDMGVTLEKMQEIYAEETVLKRIGQPEDVAYMVKFLIEYGAKYMSGKILQTNGGECRCTSE